MSDSNFFWTGKECPDCGGELEQQDEHNVMCLTCETVFQHILSDAEHVLHHQDLGIAAEEPRMATDGGQAETGDISQSQREIREGDTLTVELEGEVVDQMEEHDGVFRIDVGVQKVEILTDEITDIEQPDRPVGPAEVDGE